MDRFARVVLGYHGTSSYFADQILTGKQSISEWPRSRNKYDWLGEGIYFWEHAPERALRWAEHALKTRPERYPDGATAAVIGAVIQLNPCFDLTDLAATEMLREGFVQLNQSYGAEGKALPTNHGGAYMRMRDLDCLVINYLLDDRSRFKTVRGVFLEGEEAYPGAMIRKESHVQIAVRDPSCILGVFRPNLGE